uniref:U-scoloptoxin(21)-Sm2a n=1 Tax=Scolopendra morsitans TaxID=943129 RepID=TXL2A_SCOMO|nr:RecName: Full=U-scoloptoxin(21)-Sm2a; Short=U-SLPTX(21)-Sm2a; Flags: Precursor [Scolopendra morsitans]
MFFLGFIIVCASEEQSDNRLPNIDFGLDRGHSGRMTAEYLMGLAAANDPNGPGRRRRSPIVREEILRHP